MENNETSREVVQVRILPPRLTEGLVNTEFARLFNYQKTSCVSASVSGKTLFKPPVAMPFPYKLPRLIIPDAKSKDQRWIIKYYVWSADVKKTVMIRDLSCNQLPAGPQRKQFCKMLMADISKLLKEGYHIDSAKEEAQRIEALRQEQGEYMKLHEAMELAMNIKRSQKIKSIRNYEFIYSKLVEWMALSPSIKNLPIHNINRTHIEDFLNRYMDDIEEPISGRTYNNYLELVKHLFFVLVDREYILKNPCDKLEKRRQKKGRNIAYTIQQQITLVEFMKSKYIYILAFCKTMYYSLMRTTEISEMRAWWIGAYDPNKIYLPAQYSKNGHERHITIPPQLERVIRDMGWRDLHPETVIFSSGFRPGKKVIQGRMHANKYRRWVLDKLNFSKDYTLYSWKHTGVVFLYRNNIKRAEIRMQAGFLDDVSFEAYLKSLGLFENENLVTDYPSLPE